MTETPIDLQRNPPKQALIVRSKPQATDKEDSVAIKGQPEHYRGSENAIYNGNFLR